MLMNTIKEKNKLIEECISSLAQGNISKMDDLYNCIKSDVFAYALSKTCNKDDADDITHDTFLQIYKNAKLYTPRGKPLAWIITIESNLINRHFQLKSRNIDLTDEILEKQISDNDFEKNSINSEFLKNILRNLNEDERVVISLHIVSGLKFKELANQLNKPISSVLSKYNRAIKKLKNKVKEDK